MLRRLVDDAMRGDRQALKNFLLLYDRVAPEAAATPMAESVPYKTLMLLGNSPEDQQKAMALYQGLIRGSKVDKK